MVSEYGELCRGLREEKRSQNALRYDENTIAVATLGLKYESKNCGHHLIIKFPNGELADFWPASGKWHARGFKQYGVGLDRLVKRYNFCSTD